MNELHVLKIPSWYPTKFNPISGIFFQDQAIELTKFNIKVGIIYSHLLSAKNANFSSILKKRNTEITGENGLNVLRTWRWAIPKFHRFNRKLWEKDIMRLLEIYISYYGRPHIIHAHSIIWAGVVAQKISLMYDIPFIITEHRGRFVDNNVIAGNLLNDWQTPYISTAVNSASKIIAVSSSMVSKIKKYSSDSGLKIEVIPNMVDTDFFVPSLKRIESMNFKIVTIAGLTYIKGLDVLVKAVGKLDSLGYNVTLEIGGEGEELQNIKQLIANLSLSRRIKILGKLSREKVKEVLEYADLFVLPSRVEAFGVVLIEALSMGLPVVSTNSGGPSDIIQEFCGVLVKPDNVNELTDAIKYILDNYDKYEKDKIRSYAIANYSKKAIATKIVDVYNSILD